MEPIKQNCNVPRGQQKDNISFWSRKKYFSSPMNAERLDVILPIVGSNINEQIWVKVKVSRNVPRGQVFLLSTGTLEGDKIGCIYSVMIKMATTTNVQVTTEDRRRQKYRKNNPKLVQLSNLKFLAKVWMIWMNKVKKYIHGHCLTKLSISDFQGSPVILYDAILRHWQICYLYFSWCWHTFVG